MKAYLPERLRAFGALCGDDTKPQSLWKQLALVGRDIALDLPLDQIPLMKQVAAISVRAFEGPL